jgi:hypothetical protein
MLARDVMGGGVVLARGVVVTPRRVVLLGELATRRLDRG